ncbi:hypothetical protein AKJ09_05743 [Labilithrix luteola]|uniref:Uncharacterized protein n=1 Tax=Labilithrix luteola TaxID=1391654 RepID=A0A0K1Q0Z2_9BACT|nr:hypothetical protein [Labilithrix luteola]AKU99079.1 hypothetical protein AKJ09_05743 [Labilithrix luteola]
MSEHVCRGYMIHSTATYIETAYAPMAKKGIYDRIPPHTRELLATLELSCWYPTDDLMELLRAIASHHRDTDGEQRLTLERVGRTIAEPADSTSLRLLFKLMTPALFATKAPALWERNNRGSKLRVVTYDDEARRMTVGLEGTRGRELLGALVPGFVSRTLELMGCTDPSVTSPVLDDAPHDELLYAFAWRG